MGDGINRILTIILALVNCDHGYLMVDEIETGLHYTVLFVLWKVIYELASKLNVQVFATTHSTDCIRCYGDFLKEIDIEGNLIRLDNFDDGIKATLYPVPEILIAKEHQIEVR
jgi:AAA15 family ATPase/GTPase